MNCRLTARNWIFSASSRTIWQQLSWKRDGSTLLASTSFVCKWRITNWSDEALWRTFVFLSVFSAIAAQWKDCFASSWQPTLSAHPEARGWEALYFLYYQKAWRNFTKKTLYWYHSREICKVWSWLTKVFHKETLTQMSLQPVSNVKINSRKSSEGCDCHTGYLT